MALPVSRLIRVAINLSPLAAQRRSFGILMVAGDSEVINPKERIRSYDSYEGVSADFGVDAPESEAAALFFGQSPKPKTINIGRWVRVASSALNIGGVLTASQKVITLWNTISSGGFTISIDGVVKNLLTLDFSSVSNLNGVASVINASLTGGSIEWDGSKFVVSSDSTGAGVKASGTITMDTNPSYGAQASSTIELTGIPANGNTVVIQGTTVTFVSGTPSGNQVQIAGSAALTAAALQTFLAASADSNLALMTYNTIAAITTITARAWGVAGNSYTLTKVGANITVSGATFTGGVARDTLTVNGTAISFVHDTPTGSQVLVAPTVAGTSANLQAFLQASVISGVALATYASADEVTTVTYKTAGTAGNSFTLAKSSSHITISGAVLASGAEPSAVSFATAAGSGTDISVMLKLTSALSQGLIDGYDAETPAECTAVLANKSAQWYGLMFNASVQPTDDQNIDVCDAVEAFELHRMFGVTITNTNVLSAIVTDDLASQMRDNGYNQSMNQYSSSSDAAIASLFGRIFSVDFNQNRSTITAMYKQEPGVAGEDLTTTEANTLQTKRCNVFVDYVNDTKIIQYGVMSGSRWIDETHGLDWLQDAVQNACYNLNYTSPTKIPQTDAGANQFLNAVQEVFNQAGTENGNGLIGPGVWNGNAFGSLVPGMFLKTGSYLYVQPVALQSQADRDARKCPPIQGAIKLAGAIQEADILINVNR